MNTYPYVVEFCNNLTKVPVLVHVRAADQHDFVEFLSTVSKLSDDARGRLDVVKQVNPEVFNRYFTAPGRHFNSLEQLLWPVMDGTSICDMQLADVMDWYTPAYPMGGDYE